jgi:hypothetical protein
MQHLEYIQQLNLIVSVPIYLDENLGYLNKHIYSSIFFEVSLCLFGSCVLNIDMLICSEGSL